MAETKIVCLGQHLQALQWVRQSPPLPVLHAHPVVLAATKYNDTTEVTSTPLTFQHVLFILTCLPADPIAPGRPGWPASPCKEASKFISDFNNLRGKKFLNKHIFQYIDQGKHLRATCAFLSRYTGQTLKTEDMYWHTVKKGNTVFDKKRNKKNLAVKIRKDKNWFSGYDSILMQIGK